METKNHHDDSADQEVVITRDFDAPRELVFEMWTKPEHLLRWYAPRGCTVEFRSIDVREGGRFHSCIRNPEFGDCWCIGEYHEIRKPERIVYSMEIADEKGNSIPPAKAGHDPEWPAVSIVTVTLQSYNGKTRLTLRQNVSASLAKKTGAYPSWLQMLDILAEKLGEAVSVG